MTTEEVNNIDTTQETIIVNPLEYGYTPEQRTEIPSIAITNIIYFLEKVLETQPRMGVPYVFPQDVEITKDANGNISKVDVNWKNYDDTNSQAFFQSVNNPIPIATEISILAEQLKFSMIALHQSNIQMGLAKKVENQTEAEVVDDVLKG